jgi:hypothetical protein
MALVRITFRDYLTHANTYILPINPNEMDLVDSDDYEMLQTLDGAPIKSNSSFDDRIRTLTWPYFPADNTTFSGMKSVLKSYIGLNKEIYLGTIDNYYSYSWRHIHVVDVTTSLMSGGRVRQNLTLQFYYLENH